MTTGTIIFIVVLVLQGIIRLAAKQAEKKANAAKAQGLLPVTQQSATLAEAPNWSKEMNALERSFNAVERSFDAADDEEEEEEDPEGEATSSYLHDRVQQIHDSALRGRHPKPVAPLASCVAKSSAEDRAPKRGVRSTLQTKGGLRQGFVLAEVLGPPVSLRKSL